MPESSVPHLIDSHDKDSLSACMVLDDDDDDNDGDDIFTSGLEYEISYARRPMLHRV